MVGRTKTATKEEAARMLRLKDTPCIACSQRKFPSFSSNVEVHHLLSGNKRRGHLFTIPLCSWHHRGQSLEAFHASDLEFLLGPSLARTSKKFHEVYGSDDELLELTNKKLGEIT